MDQVAIWSKTKIIIGILVLLSAGHWGILLHCSLDHLGYWRRILTFGSIQPLQPFARHSSQLTRHVSSLTQDRPTTTSSSTCYTFIVSGSPFSNGQSLILDSIAMFVDLVVLVLSITGLLMNSGRSSLWNLLFKVCSSIGHHPNRFLTLRQGWYRVLPCRILQ